MKPTFLGLVFLLTVVTAKANGLLSPTDSLILSRSKPETVGKRSAWRDKVSLGGNFAVQLSESLVIDVSPTTGYRITPRWVAGGGVTYIYMSGKSASAQSVYGGRTFAQVGLARWLCLRAEYEAFGLNPPPNPSLPGSPINVMISYNER